jgi:hypothetical protein
LIHRRSMLIMRPLSKRPCFLGVVSNQAIPAYCSPVILGAWMNIAIYREVEVQVAHLADGMVLVEVRLPSGKKTFDC